ncbi:phage tail assembly protein [Phyllobacterium phragmitis]|uniref:Phage tail assembly protein n=1 Tax=Phyllobacterium phragmitis TaxID=2670329 RepID=A0A2S9IP70_9HYPH|nr:phage tail assembly protein [Phyllobacterium phragmitis]PRD42326.1 phage tail assembly protein [Phyllobacterium phragmitis]
MKKVTTVTVPLEYPVQHAGAEITSLTFRRMKSVDAYVGEGDENQARVGYKLFAALAGVDLEVIENLDWEDMETIGEKVAPLMGKSAGGQLQKAVSASSGETS